MTAWSFYAVAFLDGQLFEAMASASITKRNEFKVVELASMLWSLSASSVEASPGAAEALCRLAEARPVSEGLWEGHSLCLLANALYPVRAHVKAFVWADVERRWLAALQELARLMLGVVYPVDEVAYLSMLQSTGYFHVGPHYTAKLLRTVGV